MPENNSKESLLRDIRSLLTLIDQNWNKNINDTKPLTKAVSNCSKNSTDKMWSYALNSLMFRNIDIGGNARPLKLNSKNSEITIELSVDSSGVFINDNLIKDPLNSLSLIIKIQGVYEDKSKNDVIDLFSSWHLDKGGGSTKRGFIHPEYHINFGGKSMTKVIDMNFGNLLLVGSPRIAHMPLDGILAIDFIIKNFYEEKNHKKLTDLDAYQRIQKNAQYRVWRPYAIALSSHWSCLNDDFEIDSSINPIKLIPNLY